MAFSMEQFSQCFTHTMFEFYLGLWTQVGSRPHNSWHLDCESWLSCPYSPQELKVTKKGICSQQLQSSFPNWVGKQTLLSSLVQIWKELALCSSSRGLLRLQKAWQQKV